MLSVVNLLAEMCMTASLHLEIVKACLGIIVITAIAQRIYVRQRSAAAYYLAPGIVGIACNNAAAAVDYTDNVALRVEHIIVQRIIVLHRQRLANNLFFNIHRARRAVKYQNESRSISGDILLLI